MALESGSSSIKRHAPGHAALLIEERGVLVAGDMLSDVLIPDALEFNDTADPIEDYLAAFFGCSSPWRTTPSFIPGQAPWLS